MIFRPGWGNVQHGAQVSQAFQSAAGNGLLNALIAYWPGNEANGNALDAHTNGLTLTDVNTVTTAAGLVYAGARQYTAATLEYHTKLDDAFLSTGNVDFTIATWVRFDTIGAARTLVAKWLTVGNQREYWLFLQAINKIQFAVSDSGAAAAATVDSAVIVGTTWYLVIAWHDSVSNNINIQLNNGVAVSTAYALGVFNGASDFQIGTRYATTYMDGRIGPTAFWKSAAGGGGVLDATRRTALYNAGAGLAYAAFTV